MGTSSGGAPYPLAMVICDAVWHDPSTGKRTILGCYSELHARKFPAIQSIITVYLALTDERGKVPISLQLTDGDGENAPLFRGDAEIEFADPHMITEIDFAIRGVSFPAPGEYRFQLFAANDFLMERRLFVKQIPDGA